MRSYRIFPPSFMFWTCQSNQSRMRCKFAKHQLAFLHVVERAFLCFYVISVNAFYLMLHRAGMRISFQIQEVPRKVSRISSGKLIASERFLHANEVAGVFIVFVKGESLTGIIQENREFLPSDLFELILLRRRMKNFAHKQKENGAQSSKTEKIARIP